MTSFFSTVVCFLSLGLIGQSAHASGEASVPKNRKKLEISGENQCRALIELENKEKLTPNDEIVGKMVYDLLEQVSSSPLEYCAVMAQAVVEKDPEVL